MPSLGKSFHILATRARPGRLFQEDPGVKGPLWFGRNPDSPWHVFANILRLFFAVIFAPVYICIPHSQRSMKNVLRTFFWGIEWGQTPEAILLEAPGGPNDRPGGQRGQYAVTGQKPRWLLEVQFHEDKILSLRQVQYGSRNSLTPSSSVNQFSSEALALRKAVQQRGYTAISYAMLSAEQLFQESGKPLDPQPEVVPGGNRKYSLRNRQHISRALLDEYARARATAGKADGVEYIWLDEFCLSDVGVQDEQEINCQRDMEVGNLADIFRGASEVVVFCHIPHCDHTGTDCHWGNRLFTLGEILHASQVLQMTREYADGEKSLRTFICKIPGQMFKADMQARAAEAKMWHLYNIMQHATNSGAVTWQSAIHSLVVEAIRRDEANNFLSHTFLGKALNGLLPRRSQLEDLQGVNGWADLAWLLELNQGYYNAALLAAVCELADPHVANYRWWGKPIAPREGCERLEPLVTAIPVKMRKDTVSEAEPVLSIVGPKSVKLDHMLQRDSAGLYNNDEMRPLMIVLLVWFIVLIIISLISIAGSVFAFIALFEIASLPFVIIELLVGTIYVEKKTWVVLEDYLFQGDDPLRHLQSQDHTFDEMAEWGDRQLIPRWDVPHPKDPSAHGDVAHPYSVTLIDLRTGVYTKAEVTHRPNDMVVLAVHGSGITCMLLERDENFRKAIRKAKVTIAAKVGMVNLPPFIIAQSEHSGTVYVGGGPRKPNAKQTRDSPRVMARDTLSIPVDLEKNSYTYNNSNPKAEKSTLTTSKSTHQSLSIPSYLQAAGTKLSVLPDSSSRIIPSRSLSSSNGNSRGQVVDDSSEVNSTAIRADYTVSAFDPYQGLPRSAGQIPMEIVSQPFESANTNVSRSGLNL